MGATKEVNTIKFASYDLNPTNLLWLANEPRLH